MAQRLSSARWSPSGTNAVDTVFTYAGVSHVGLVRSVNEDCFLAGPPIFAVADGMGGYERGDVAAGIVVQELEALVGRTDVTAADLEECIARSRTRVEELATADAAPGSTVIAAAYLEQSGHGYWAIAHEGDSRAYVWRNDSLVRVTKDHSLVQDMVDGGEITEEEALVHPDRHVITRAIGGAGGSRPDFSLVPVETGARLLLCSDGLTGELSEQSIATVLADERGTAEAAELLVRRAVQAGGHDNVTAVIVDEVSAVVDNSAVEDTLDSVAKVVEDTIPSTRRKA
jgi:protein phosphatase